MAQIEKITVSIPLSMVVPEEQETPASADDWGVLADWWDEQGARVASGDMQGAAEDDVFIWRALVEQSIRGAGGCEDRR